MPDEDGVSIELVRVVIASLKKGKACGIDQVESEAWMWATDECIRVLAGFLDEIWRGTRWRVRHGCGQQTNVSGCWLVFWMRFGEERVDGRKAGSMVSLCRCLRREAGRT
ncbi:hypothetical protein QE152_g9160 [Popillia japonica]|uniref:Uncharacterized protein n=1 Tax=Popillia japonica TaxID=7064 RepID=A0AAW1M2A2_POPJA